MKPRLLPLFLAALAPFLAGCSGGKEMDSLERERASMEAEAKALAEHKAPLPTEQPLSSSTAGQTSGANETKGALLAAGTQLNVVLAKSLSTMTAGTGDDWLGTLATDLKAADGTVLVKAGSPTVGRIVLASDGTNIRRKHEIEIRVYRLTRPSGERVDIRTTSHTAEGADAGQRPAIVQAGERLTFQLASETRFP